MLMLVTSPQGDGGKLYFGIQSRFGGTRFVVSQNLGADEADALQRWTLQAQVLVTSPAGRPLHAFLNDPLLYFLHVQSIDSSLASR